MKTGAKIYDISVFGPDLRLCRALLRCAAEGPDCGPGDWPVDAFAGRLVAMHPDASEFAVQVPRRLFNLTWPKLDAFARTRAICLDSALSSTARARVLVLPAIPACAGHVDFTDQVLADIQAAEPRADGALLLILTDALRHFPCSPPAFDAIDTWEAALDGTPPPAPFIERTAAQSNWHPVLTALDDAWEGRLNRLAHLARADGMSVTAIPCCIAGFAPATGALSASHPFENGRPFNLASVANALVALASNDTRPSAAQANGIEL